MGVSYAVTILLLSVFQYGQRLALVLCVSGDGMLSLANPVAASLGAGAPIDCALSSDGEFLYVVDSALSRIVSFQVHGISLHHLAVVGGLPTTIQSLAAK